MRRDARRQAGVVLMVVLFFALLLTASIASFTRRSLVDALIARNRDTASRAEALARGGVRIAEAVLVQDRLSEEAGAPETDDQFDAWAQLGATTIPVGDATLQIDVQDTGQRLNLNALFTVDETGERGPKPETTNYLIEVFKRIIDEMDLPPGEKELYEPRDLAGALIDWVDSDDGAFSGGQEDAYYQEQDPPYRAANRPLLSIDELGLIEGFDERLVAVMKQYFSVYPFAPGGCTAKSVGCGINVNTAPPHVLGLLYVSDGVANRLAPEDTVRRILDERENDRAICVQGASEPGCTPITEIVGPNPIFPPPTFSAEMFVVTSRARIGEVERTVEAVVDRSEPSDPRLLSWRVR